MLWMRRSGDRAGILYGTAWKEAATARCVELALTAGFRGLDTANQRKHYDEDGVGAGIVASGIPRDQLFLQTKFTFVDGQDHRLPYDPRAPIAAQVAQSFESSLEHLRTTWLDSLVLHGPSRRDGLGPPDHEAWRAMEALVDSGRVRALGISNASAGQVEQLVAFARVRPTFVQNRCYARTGWDRGVREVCARHRLTYQGFSLLTANREAMRVVSPIATRHGRTPAQVIFGFAQQIGILPLTGTQDLVHMRDDLASSDLTLAPDEVAAIERAETP
jgi:diketogulonate reductase-like aldo/keto reductase